MRRPALALSLGVPASVVLGVGFASAIDSTPPAPVGPEASQPANVAPAPGPRSSDPGGGRSWVVRTYPSKTDWTCAQAAQTDGNNFGRGEPNGKIAPLPVPESGSCADLSKVPVGLWVDHYPPGDRGGARAVIFGAVDRTITSVSLVLADRSSQTLAVVNGGYVVTQEETTLDGAVMRFKTAAGTVLDHPLHPAPVAIAPAPADG